MGLSFGLPRLALVRAVSADFEACLRSGDEPIDVELARTQHAAYVGMLEAAGVEVVCLPALEGHPDAVYVEDTAVIHGPGATLCIPGALSRQGETETIAAALSTRGPLERMTPPARLDGGDVLRVGARLFVGLSERTNQTGLDQLAGSSGMEVIGVALASGLHLKSACTLADAGTLLYTQGAFDLAAFADAGLDCVPVSEPAGANVLALEHVVLVSADAPGTAALLEARGLAVARVPLGELHKGDGALTCLSLRWPAQGCWCC